MEVHAAAGAHVHRGGGHHGGEPGQHGLRARLGAVPYGPDPAQPRGRRHPVPDHRSRAAHQPGILAPRAARSREAACGECTAPYPTCSRGRRLMAIGVKVLERPIEQTSYIRATLGGMKRTFLKLFDEKVTTQYPEEK